jgi:two-component system, cell cycle sensor histidine kinase and response regulator CckA
MSEREKSARLSVETADALLASRFAALFEHMEEGVALHELVLDGKGEPIDYRTLDVNPQFEVLTGYRRAEVVDRPASQAYGTGKPPFLEKFAAVVLGQVPLRFDYDSPKLGKQFALSVAPLGPRSFATIFSDVTLAKRQAAAIEKSRLSLRALLDNQPHLAWLKDREGRFLAVNQAFAQACGQPSPDAVVGKTDLDVWPLELAEAYRADDEAVMASGGQKMVEEQIAEIDGTRWFETYKSPVLDAQGNIVGTTGIARDITGRKRAEEARLQSERKLGRVLDLAPDPIAVINAKGEWTFANQAFCELCGYQRSEFLGHKTSELEVWQDPGFPAAMAERLERDGYAEGMETILRSLDGTRHHVEFTATVVEFDEATATILAGRDVTRSRQAEASAERSRARLLSVSELAHIGHFTIDFPSGTATWTPELYRIFGWNRQSQQPTIEAVRAVIFAEDRGGADAAILAVRESGQAQQFHFRALRPNGEIRHCLAIVELESNSPLAADRIYGLVQDLTELRRAEEERRKLEQQVMQSQKLESLGVLAGGIAHDFNNLLTSILGNADLACSELAPTNPARPYLEDIEHVSRRAADLCKQMLAYSGKGRFVVQPISLNDVIREMGHLLSVSISKKVVIKYNFFADLPCVMADATQMRQVVMNLITNASEAIAEASGVVTLSTGVMDCDEAYLATVVDDQGSHPAGQYVTMEVSDTGCGMDPETLGRIFDPFFTTKFTGRGLGLAAVLGIVRGHKGALRVYSEKGHGTTFKILLPAYEQVAPTVLPGTDDERSWRGSGLVLLADDEDSIRSMGRRLLERAGFEVIVAADGREALDLFVSHRQRVRLVVLDMTMPHLDGEICYRELRRLDPAVKVIMTSGYNEQEVINRFVGKGLAGFVQKPYKASDLLAVIRKVLEKMGD